MPDTNEEEQLYRIKRFYAPHTGKENHFVEGLEDLTLAEAREHCADPDTKCKDYFDGFVKQ